MGWGKRRLSLFQWVVVAIVSQIPAVVIDFQRKVQVEAGT